MNPRGNLFYITCILVACFTMPLSFADHHAPDDRLLPQTLLLTFSFHGRELSATTVLPEFKIESRTSSAENLKSGEHVSHIDESEILIEGQILYDEKEERYIVVCRGKFEGNMVENHAGDSDSESLSNMHEYQMEFQSSVALMPGQESVLVRQDADALVLKLQVVD